MEVVTLRAERAGAKAAALPRRRATLIKFDFPFVIEGSGG